MIKMSEAEVKKSEPGPTKVKKKYSPPKIILGSMDQVETGSPFGSLPYDLEGAYHQS